VFINMAMTADGKIATANRAVSSFGSPRDLEHLYELRATADAVMCGARTVEQSNATLGNGGDKFGRLRLRRGLAGHPLRIIVSGSGSISPKAMLWSKRFSPIVVLTSERASLARLKRLRALADHVWISPGETVDFAAALAWLKREFKIRRLLCEGGGEVNDTLLRAGLVDELHLTLCPRIVGGRLAPTIADGTGFARLADSAQLELKSAKRVADELFLVYRVNRQRSADGTVAFSADTPRPAA
jgi:2,5-diamino-6-(ribosylamino)-4(3H)-pyrimidinone 5'-phosphate reductase